MYRNIQVLELKRVVCNMNCFLKHDLAPSVGNSMYIYITLLKVFSLTKPLEYTCLSIWRRKLLCQIQRSTEVATHTHTHIISMKRETCVSSIDSTKKHVPNGQSCYMPPEIYFSVPLSTSKILFLESNSK